MTATEKSTLLQLPAHERAEIAELLLHSFDTPDQPAIDAAWARESEERIAAFERGEITATDGAAAIALRAKGPATSQPRATPWENRPSRK